MKRWFPNPMLALLAALVTPCASAAQSQSNDTATLSAQVQQLSQAVQQAQAQLQQSQLQLDDMRRQLAALQAQLAQNAQTTAVVDLANKTNALEEQQEVQAAEIATHDQSKVESSSKYSVRLTGLVLFNGFVDAGGVDSPDVPTVAEAGAGATGVSMRQTQLGFDATGPHVFGATTYADARVDFYGNPQVSVGNYSGAFYGHPTLLRLRSAHAGVRWTNSELSFSIDRPLIGADPPSSLSAVAMPPLAWSGSLWQWNQQLTFSHDLSFGKGGLLTTQVALIDTQDALMPSLSTSVYTARSLYSSFGEQSRWPGFEARVALGGRASDQDASHIAFGGYFAPHLLPDGTRYNAWAGALDGRARLSHGIALSGSFYRGAGLGGLGAGTYKDFTYIPDRDKPGSYYYKPLDDVGGWAGLTKHFSERLEFNAALGLDNAFAHELPRLAPPINYSYAYLARNRTIFANMIFSPSAYLLFSFEYRHLTTTSSTGAPSDTNVVGLAAGYRF